MKRSFLFLGIVLLGFFLFQNNVLAQVGTKITQTTLVKIKLNYTLHNACFGDKKGDIFLGISRKSWGDKN